MIIKNNIFEILTPDGFKDFDGLLVTEDQECIELVFLKHRSIKVTKNHLIQTVSGFKEASKLIIGDEIVGEAGVFEISEINSIGSHRVYDPINVDQVDSTYISNGLYSHNCALFIGDELAHVKRNIQDEMWASIFPTLSTGGSCVIMSTPNGDSDLFANLWRGAVSGNNGFVPLEVKNSEVPDRDAAWEAMMRAKFGDLRFSQEFLCEFVSSDPLLINSLVLQALRSTPPIFVDKGFKFWREPNPMRTYIVGIDVAEGVNQDYSTIQVIELETMEQIIEFRNNKIKEDQLYEAIKWILTKIGSYEDRRTQKKPQIYWSFENNSVGAVIGALYYQDEKFPPDPELVNGKGEKLGMRTVNKPKVEAARSLKNLLEKSKGQLKLNSDALIFELKNYVSTGAGYAAKPGSTDDLISAFLIVMRIVKYIAEFEQGVFDQLYKSSGEFYDETEGENYIEPLPFIM